MKRSLFLLSLLLPAGLALGGCADAPTSIFTGTAATGKPAQDEASLPPFVGMTKQQALARYGEPRRRTMTDKGEMWGFVINRGQLLNKAINPFYFKSVSVRVCVLNFGPEGRVKEFRWDAEPND